MLIATRWIRFSNLANN